MAATITELVGFVLVLLVLWRKVLPPTRRAMRKQQDLIRQQVADSKAAAERLAEAEQKYRDAIAEARTEAAQIRDGARADAERILVEMREQAEREVVRIRQRGEEDLVAQRKQVEHELRARIGELSVTLADRLVREHLATDAARSATVDRLLTELEGMAARTDGAAAGTPLAGKGEA